MRRAPALLFTILSLTISTTASAEPTVDADDVAEAKVVVRRVAAENLRRLRRAVALGPHAGGLVAYASTPGQVDGGASFGLGLYVLAVPTTFDLQDIIIEQARARLLARKREREQAEGAPLGAERVEALAREVFDDVKNEVLAKNERLPRTFEKPRFAFILEGERLFRSDAWQVRFTPSIGLSYVSIGPTIGGWFGDKTTTAFGAEASVRALPGGGPRSPILDFFVRGEVIGLRRDERFGLYTTGVRLVLDVI